VLAPSSFQNRLPTRPEVRVFVFATHLRYAARQLPRPLWFVVGLGQLLMMLTGLSTLYAGRLSPSQACGRGVKSMRTESPTGSKPMRW